MRQLILGVIGVYLGGAMFASRFTGEAVQGSGAYQAGQTTGTIFGLIFCLAGAAAIVKALRARRARAAVPRHAVATALGTPSSSTGTSKPPPGWREDA